MVPLTLGWFLAVTLVIGAAIPRGTLAQVIGLVMWQMAFPVVIVRARLLTIGREYEEAAMDLGSSPLQAIRAVLIPLLMPAILASGAVVFADSMDNFVTVRYLSAGSATEPVSVKIYTASRGATTPAVNAAGTVTLLLSLASVGIGFLIYRASTRRDRSQATISG